MRNMDGKGHSHEVSDGNEEHAIQNCSQGGPCYEVATNLAELCPRVSWEVELMSNDISCLAKTISKQYEK